MAISGNVYDVTKYIAMGLHNDRIVEGCGIDATDIFGSVDKHAGPTAQSLLKDYFIGALN
jgi:cytochrome b involved in lipid metabolism